MLSLLLALTLGQNLTQHGSKYYDPGATAPPWQGQGGIKSEDFKVEHRDDNGNVIGTDFVHLEYTVSCRDVPMPASENEEDVYIECNRICKKKHKSHKECDLSCDEQCTK